MRPAGGRGAVHAGSTAASEGGVAQAYERCLPLADAERGAARLRDERRAAAAAARLPAAAGRAGLVRHDERQVARAASRCSSEPFEGYQNAVAYRMYDADGEPGEPLTRMLPRSLMVPPGVPDFMTRERHLEPGPVTLRGPRLVGLRGDRAGGGVHRRRRELRRRRARRAARRGRLARLALRLGRRAGRARALLARHRRRRQRAAARAALEPQGLREQRGRAHRRSTVELA